MNSTFPKPVFSLDWDAFLQSSTVFGFRVVSSSSDAGVGQNPSINLIAAHPQLKLLLHARSIGQHVDSAGRVHTQKVGTAVVYGMARARSGRATTLQSALGNRSSWPTTIETCKGFQLCTRTGFDGVTRLRRKLEFVDWFEMIPVTLTSYANLGRHGGLPPMSRRAVQARMAFFLQSPQWVRDFAIPYLNDDVS